MQISRQPRHYNPLALVETGCLSALQYLFIRMGKVGYGPSFNSHANHIFKELYGAPLHHYVNMLCLDEHEHQLRSIICMVLHAYSQSNVGSRPLVYFAQQAQGAKRYPHFNDLAAGAKIKSTFGLLEA